MPGQPIDVESRWPVILALATVVVLHSYLPEGLTLGPRWMLVVIFTVLAATVSILHSKGLEIGAYAVGLILISTVTAAVVGSLFLLIRSLPAHRIQPVHLLQSAAFLWISNVLVFAAWYWKLDAGGPYAREKAALHEDGAFLFPQMTLHQQARAKPKPWHPRYIDYLFLSFNTSTALSPADTQVLSRWAKGLMMLQSLISLTIIVLLAARAVNIL